MKSANAYYPKVAFYQLLIVGKHQESHKIEVKALRSGHTLSKTDFDIDLAEETLLVDERTKNP